MTTAEVARALGYRMSTFYSKLPQLRKEGFPERDPLLRKWHRPDIEAWLEARRTNVSTKSAEQILLERSRNWHRAA